MPVFCAVISGEIHSSYGTNVIGNQLNENENDTNPFRYCGEYLDSETGLTYLRNRYYDNAIGRFITEDPIKDGLNWYVYCENNPVMFADYWGLEDIVVAGGAYYVGDGAYQYEFVDSALLQISTMNDATLLVANAGWTNEQYKAIVQAAQERNINLLWFSSIDSLIKYINNGRDRTVDPITSFYVFAHGTDSGTGKYAITFGLYTDIDEQLRLYTSDISNINRAAFDSESISMFYACRTGNDFDNGNFARSWAWITGGKTFAYSGINGRSEYSNILGTKYERHVKTKAWKEWDKKRGDRAVKPSEAFRFPEADIFASMKYFLPMKISAPLK